jgi:hypothetical protein
MYMHAIYAWEREIQNTGQNRKGKQCDCLTASDKPFIFSDEPSMSPAIGGLWNYRHGNEKILNQKNSCLCIYLLPFAMIST